MQFKVHDAKAKNEWVDNAYLILEVVYESNI